jgi:activating signal cointegrator complex subunit 3
VYLSRGFLDGFSLVADSSYINASLGRIMRALFEICLRRSWVTMAALLLEYCKAVDRRVWPHQHPLRQFDTILSQDVRSSQNVIQIFGDPEKVLSGLICIVESLVF